VKRVLGGLLVAGLLGCSGPGGAARNVSGAANGTHDGQRAIEPIKVYHGIVSLDMRLEWRDGPTEEYEALTVIRDDVGLREFLQEIPATTVSRTRPAPPNDDPLLKGLSIDFENELLIILRRNSMSHPVCTAIWRHNAIQQVVVEYPDEPYARPYGTGTYTALLVDKFDGVTVLRRAGASHEQPRPATGP
jgi:hypothetical protein